MASTSTANGLAPKAATPPAAPVVDASAEAAPPSVPVGEGAGAATEPAQAQAAAQVAADGDVFTVHVRTPAGVMLTLHNISGADTASAIRQVLAETSEACQFTCYHLEVEGASAVTDGANAATSGLQYAAPSQSCVQGGLVLNEFQLLQAYGDAVRDGTVLRMVPQLYDEETVRFHVRRVRDMLQNPRAPHFHPALAAAAADAAAPDGSDDDNSGDAATTQQGEAKTEAANGDADTPADGDSKAAAATDADADATPEELAARKQALMAKVMEQRVKAGKRHLRHLRQLVKNLNPPPVPVPFKVGDVVQSPCAVPYMELVRDSVAAAGGKGAGAGVGGVLPMCVKRISYSGWNPPTPRRRLAGDILYLEVETLEHQTLHVTANARGFYVNGSRGEHFNPLPAHQPSFAHNLVDLLTVVSPLFKRNYGALLTFAAEIVARNTLEEMSPAEVLAAAGGETLGDGLNAPPHYGNVESSVSWLAKRSELARDVHGTSRAEDYLTLQYTQDGERRSMQRDWNDEYQLVLDLPHDTPQQGITRWRAIYKTQTAFLAAAVSAAVDVFHGHVLALNASDPPHARVFVHNHIFFSVAPSKDAIDAPSEQDSVEDPAAVDPVERAHVRIAHDLAILPEIAAVDSKELRTVLTAVIEYQGQRLVAQSIIPGILQSEKVAHVVYGSPDHGRHVEADPRVHTTMQALAARLHIADRVVVPTAGKGGDDAAANAADESKGNAEAAAGAANGIPEADYSDMNSEPVSLIGPVELKIIVGSDNRSYVLDIERFTPVDANYIDEEHPRAAGNRRRLLRPELVQRFVRRRTVLAAKKLRAAVAKQHAKAAAKAAAVEGADGSKTAEAEGAAAADAEGEAAATPKGDADVDATAGAGAGAGDDGDDVDGDEDEEVDLQAVAAAELDAAKIRFNVNAFTPFCAGQDEETLAKDEAAVRELSAFLKDRVIPSFLHDVVTRRITVATDGGSLVTEMHARGINVRYLGQLASMASTMADQGKAPLHVLAMFEAEMVVRAAKRLFVRLMGDQLVRSAPAAAVAALLNCVLGAPEAVAATVAAAAAPGGGDATAADASARPTDIGPSGDTPAAHATASNGASRGRRGRGKHGRGGDGFNPRGAAAAGGAAAVGGGASAWATVPGLSPEFVATATGVELTHAAVWSEIAAIVKRAYDWELKLWANGGYEASASGPAGHARLAHTPRLPVLRRFCQKTGVRVACREYAFGATDAAPLRASDVADLLPVVKAALPASPCPLATQYHTAGRQHFAQGHLEAAYDCLRTAQHMLFQVCGVAHPEAAHVLSTLAIILHAMGRSADAVNVQRKATELFERVCGIDDTRTITAHSSLGELMQYSGDVNGALMHWSRSITLLNTTHGAHSGHTVAEYLKMGVLYQQLQQFALAAQCQSHALSLAVSMNDPTQQAECRHNLALCLSQAGRVQDARKQMVACHDLYKRHYGEEHSRTRECKLWLRKLTERGVTDALKQQTLEDARQQQAEQQDKAPEAGSGKGGKSKRKARKRSSRR